MNLKFAEAVYDSVKLIPLGKVTTFSQIAIVCGKKHAINSVIHAIKHNLSPETIPCHRVVTSSGKLAPFYVFGSKHIQKKLLSMEGVEVKKGRVDLKKYGFIYW